MFNRYAIVSDEDVSDTMGKLESQKKLGREEAAKGQKSAASELFAHRHDSGTIEKDGPKNSAQNLHQPVAVNLPN